MLSRGGTSVLGYPPPPTGPVTGLGYPPSLAEPWTRPWGKDLGPETRKRAWDQRPWGTPQKGLGTREGPETRDHGMPLVPVNRQTPVKA